MHIFLASYSVIDIRNWLCENHPYRQKLKNTYTIGIEILLYLKTEGYFLPAFLYTIIAIAI